MINYENIEEGKEITGVCENVMHVFNMVSVKYGDDRLQKDIIEYINITEIKDIE